MYKQMEAIKNPKRREIMRALIDDELTSLNAQTETDRESQLLQRLDQTIPF
jgi:DNA-binding transcriptional ArsR family regulator